MKKTRILLSFLLIALFSAHAQQGEVQKYITVDQFGYRLGDMKFAVIVDPQIGFNADDSFVPGNAYEVRRWGTNETVFSGSPEIWKDGAIHENSGDRGWHFNFTNVQEEGDYYVYDVENDMRSYKFHIGDDVYEDVLKAAMRMFYYNRSGIAKEAPYAESNWVVNEVFNENEEHSYFVDDMDNEALVKDMSKGWMDAGDSNKYVTFTSSPMHQLLTSYQENTSMWNTLDLNIPESGNGVPDILDELKWELDWLMKMQDMDDGGVFLKIGVRGFGEVPWEDERKRFYEQKCSSSTIAAAGMFAHAYLVYKNIPGMADYAEELKMRAELAWSNFKDLNEGIFETNCDPQYDPNKPYVVDGDGSGVCCGDADREVSPQKGEASVAAAYLLGATGEQKYQDAFLEYYESNANYVGYTTWGQYRTFMGDALTYYTSLPNADQSAKANIINNKTSGSNNAGLFMFEQNDDLYNAAFNSFHWGSAQVRSNLGNAAFDFVRYGVNTGNNDKYIQRAKNLLHHFHGVNPLSMAYLTNMKESSMIKYGAEFSVSEIFHTWFEEGTEYDNSIANTFGPAPGFLPGGPNSRYDNSLPYRVKLGNTLYDGEIRNQPNEKAFTVENLGWDEELQQITNSWQLNEPGIYYQAAYIKLLANFVGKDSKDGTIDVGDPSNFVAATLLKEVEQGDTFNAGVNYTSDREATIILRLLNTSTETPTEVITISENVTAGTDEATLSFDIPTDLPAGDFYTVDISLMSTDLQTELAFYPGQPLTVYLPGEKPVRHSLNTEIPAFIEPGTELTFDLNYYTEDDGNLFVNIFETSTGEWVPVFDGSSNPILANTSGTETFSFTIPEDIDVEGSYFVWLTIFDAGWSNILAREQVNISFKEDTSTPATENSLSAEIPTSFEPGTTTGIEITYSALEDANIFINIFDDSSGEWVALGDGSSQSVVAGSTGIATLDVTVPEDAREGGNYIVFLNMFNADYSATLATFPNSSVTVGEGATPPTENSISASIPDIFAPGSVTPIDIEYSALEDANVFINIFDTSSGEWVSLNDGASQPVSGNTSGTITLDVTVPDDAREGDGYIVFLNLFNADYSGNLASFPNTEVSVGQVITPPTENSISAVIPDTFAPGSTTPIDIAYTALEDANIFINIFDTSSGEWVELNSGASTPVIGNTSGTVTLDITIPDDAREGDDYLVFLNLFSGDYSATLATFPNSSVSVGEGATPPTENSISASIPDIFAPGSVTPIDIEYSALEDANIFINIFDTSSGEWVSLNDGASQPVAGNTSGTITLDVTVPDDAREGDGYIVFLNLFNADYSGNLAGFPNTNVSVGQPVQPPTENSISAVIPDTFAPGTATPIDIEYTAIEDGNIFLRIYDASSGEWVALNGGASQPVAANTAGTVTLDVEVPEGVREGDGYIIFLRLFNGDWSGELASFPNTDVSVQSESIPVQNLLLTSMCSNDPETSRRWRVRNSNDFDVAVRWEVYGTDQEGLLTAVPGDTFFETETIDGANTTKIFWFNENGEEQSTVKASGGATCENPTIENLLLTSLCSDSPDISRRWRVRNSNDFDLEVRWEVVGTDQSGTLMAATGDNFFETETIDGANTTKIFWSDENGTEQSTVKASSGSICPTNVNYVLISNKQTGTYLRPNGEGTDAQIIVAENDGTDWFLWEKVPAENGYYFLKNKKTNAYFRPMNGNNGSSLLQKPVSWNGNWTQWSESLSDDGTHSYLINKATGKHIRPANAANNAVQLQPSSWRGSWTRWSFEPATAAGLVSKLPSASLTIGVFPNPASSYLQIEGNVSASSYTIYDIVGRAVKLGNLSKSTSQRIDIGALETGLYLLKIGEHTIKVVKK